MKFPAYPEFTPSGIEALGEIPKHWKLKKLKFLLAKALQYGANESAEGDDPQLPRYVRITDIDESGNLRDDTFRSLPKDVALPYLLEDGDLLFARSGATSGKTFLYSKSWGICAYAGYLIRARLDKSKGFPRYVKYFTSTSNYWQWLSSIYIQATIQNVSAEKYGDLWLTMPPVSEQHAIADFLDAETAKLDTLVAKKRELIEKLKEKRSALISRTVTRGLPPEAARAAGLNPNPKLKPSGIEWLGEIPEHWEVVPLGYLVQFRGGATPDKGRAEYWEGPIPWVSPKDMKQPRIVDVDDHISEEALRDSPLTMIPVDAVLIVVRGMILAHSFPVALVQVPLTINQDMKALVCGKRLQSRFSSWALSGYEKIFVSFADESAHGTRKIETQILSRFPFPLPSPDEQRVIADYLDRETNKIDRMVAKVDEAIERLQEYRTALITAAVTGKIDVRNVLHSGENRTSGLANDTGHRPSPV